MSRTMPLARSVLSTSVLGGMLFVCAGQIHAPMLEAYLAVFASTGLVTALVTDTSQDGERRKPSPEEIHPNSRRGATALFLATVVVAAPDAGRFHWTKALGGTTQMFALTALVFAAGFQTWTMVTNPFFSTAIRVQTEREHEFATRGPYCFVRHPGYLAMAIIEPATNLALGSAVTIPH